MSSLINKVVFIVLGSLLLASGIGNVYQHLKLKQNPKYEETIVRDTITHIDTITALEIGSFELINPTPVMVDSFISVHRDTFYHKYGRFETSEKVRGDLLSKGVKFEFDIPTYYKTRTITNTVTKTIRNNLLYVTGGFNYNYVNQGFYPSAGLTYIWNNQKRIMSLEYSLDKRIDLSVGFSLWR